LIAEWTNNYIIFSRANGAFDNQLKFALENPQDILIK